MASLNIRVDDNIKQQAFLAFDNLGVTPSDAIRAFLAYVATTGKMPVHEIVVSDEEADLVALIKQRLSETDKIKSTTLDELFS